MRLCKLSVAAVAAAAGLALSASSAVAQDIQWNSGVDGNWNDVTKWNPQNIPDNAGENAVFSVAGTYSATLNFADSIGALKITRKTATVGLLDGTYLLLHANSTNNGKLIINSSGGASNTYLRFDGGDYTLSGTGQLIMVLGSGDLNDARIDTNGASITQAAGHTIRGAGNIGAILTNNGTIIADVNGQTLQFTDSNKTNNSLIKATAGAAFQLNGQVLSQGPQGVLLAEDGRINLISATVAGGTLKTSGQGQIRSIGVSNANSVINEGAIGINDGQFLLVHGSMTNNGVITVNPDHGASNSTFRFDSGDQVLTGTGTVLMVLGSGDLNDARLDTNSATVTIDVDQTVRGAGNIGAVLTNNGTIIAEGGAQTLQFTDSPKTNNSLIKATTGAAFQITNQTVTQGAQGVLLAEGGLVNLVSSAVTGGTLQTSGQGQIRANGVSSANSVINEGAIGINDGQFLLVHGSMTNNGVITVNPDHGASNSTFRFDGGDQVLTGAGTVVMVLGSGDLNDARLDTNSATVTIDVDQTVRGAGNIGAVLTNNGTIIAEGNAQTLQFTDSTKTNNSLIKATAGAAFQILSQTVTQGAQGVILAEDGLVYLLSAAVTGGTLETSGQGQVRASGISYANAVTNEGAIGINDGQYLLVHDGMTNNGVITVNPDGGASNSTLRFDGGDQTLGGTGEVVLRLGSGDFNDAQFGTSAATLTVGPGQTIRGNGRFIGGNLITVQGTLVPGDSSVGQLDVQGPITLDPAAAYRADVAPNGTFDQITVSGVATLGGALNITLLNGFVPDTCFVVPVVTAGSVQGAFDSVNGDPGNGRVWRVAYTATQAKAYVTCYADLAVDCKLDLFDFLAFVNLFNDQDPVADCTHDGSFDLFDFLCFVNAFNQGC